MMFQGGAEMQQAHLDKFCYGKRNRVLPAQSRIQTQLCRSIIEIYSRTLV